jgi:dihydrofolate reductase
MRRVRFGGAISLDGFIAGPNGEADWILMDPEIDFAAMFAQYDTLLIGRKTFTAMAQQGMAKPMPGIRSYVFSRTLDPAGYPGFTFVRDRAGDVVRELKAQPGKDIALFGGGELFRTLLAEGLVDTVEVAVVPVLLGAGIPLLPTPTNRVSLALTGHRVYTKTGTVSLTYDIRHSSAVRRPKPR